VNLDDHFKSRGGCCDYHHHHEDDDQKLDNYLFFHHEIEILDVLNRKRLNHPFQIMNILMRRISFAYIFGFSDREPLQES
jgi:hypothetical protein